MYIKKNMKWLALNYPTYKKNNVFLITDIYAKMLVQKDNYNGFTKTKQFLQNYFTGLIN